MKSEQAQKYLQMSAMHPNSPLAQDQDYVWRDASIIKAVELAEQEAEEVIEALKARAVCAFDSLDFTEFMTAECVQDFDDVKCKLRGLFIQKLNER